MRGDASHIHPKQDPQPGGQSAQPISVFPGTSAPGESRRKRVGGTKKQQYTGAGSGTELTRWSRSTWWGIGAVFIMLLTVYFQFSGGEYTGPDEGGPDYDKHVQASQLTSPPPISLDSLNIDRTATDKAQQAARNNDLIPGITSVTPDLRAQIANGDAELYSMTFFDTVAEDGDYVTITTSNGAVFGPFMITHAGMTHTIPINRASPPQITLHATTDGGGGVTVGVQTSDGVWYSNVLPEGFTQPIPLR